MQLLHSRDETYPGLFFKNLIIHKNNATLDPHSVSKMLAKPNLYLFVFMYKVNILLKISWLLVGCLGFMAYQPLLVNQR